MREKVKTVTFNVLQNIIFADMLDKAKHLNKATALLSEQKIYGLAPFISRKISSTHKDLENGANKNIKPI